MNLLYLLLCYAIIKTEDGAEQKEMMVFTQRRASGRYRWAELPEKRAARVESRVQNTPLSVSAR